MLKSTIFVLFFSCFLGRLDCADNEQRNVNHGDNVTLTCYSPRDVVILMLRWKKQDKPHYVLFIRENRIYENLQDPHFKGRVELKDPEMKNGELSVILKNVTVKDNGTYECSAAYSQQEPQLLNSITLTVHPPELRVKQGENATLECYGPKDAISVMLRWNRPNLQSHEYVFYFSDDQIQEDKQHPSFKGRVNLKDPEMKNGDFSVNLTNVVMNDSGRYDCYVGYNGKKPELINSTYLKVEEPGQTGGQSGGKEDEKNDGGQNSGLTVGLSVSVMLLVLSCLVAGFVFCRNRRGRPPPNNPMI